ncbi:MAG: WD40-repeat-containing domain protein [Linnemannia elongata]|nr:MAG: WD40-repeat-containing domain protein [Linnemannia elongata]
MNKSYHESKSRNLSYQYHLENRSTQEEFGPNAPKRVRIEVPKDVTSMEMELIVSQVAIYTNNGEPVDWTAVASYVFLYTGHRRHETACQEAFERAITMYPMTPRQAIPRRVPTQSKVSVRTLLGLRELGCLRVPLIKDHLLLHTTRSYRPVTSFNFSSGSVVDMALKTSTMKLAIANVATQDSYNRKGNLFHCDLDHGISKKLEGHTRFDQRFNQEMEATVNDIKLSNSERFFISGSDDHKTMIWHAETGALMNTIGEHTSRVTRVAIQEYAKDNQDVFATGSADGTIKIYALDDEGLIKVGNGTLARSGGRRCISSISFGFDHYWDVVAVGFEGADGQKDGAGGKQGLISIYDANQMQKSLDGDLGYRRGAFCTTEKSVSCLSFSPSGAQLVCGTSGRSSAEDDEKGDETLRVLDLKTAKVVQSAISGHEDVNLVDFSPCQRYLISGANTNETAVFDRRHMKRLLHRLKHLERNDDQSHAGITSALWWQTSSGTSQSMLMTGGGDETVRLWDLRRASEDTEIWNLDTNIGPIARMTMPPSMEHLIVGSDTGTVNIYSIDDGKVAKYKDKGMTLLNDDS